MSVSPSLFTLHHLYKYFQIDIFYWLFMSKSQKFYYQIANVGFI